MLPANFLSEPACYHCLLFYPHILLENIILKNTNLPVYKRVRAVMADSGEKLALSMVIVPRKSEAPSLVCSRDMATPLSFNYCEQSYPEGIHSPATTVNTAYLLPLNKGKAVLSLKLVWNGVLYLVSGCKATRKQVS